jgi:glycosyltransferase involved in cell wall biosynthesis
MASPGVSIVVPVYNGAAHLAATLESLLAQSYQDFELLVIDDGSTDGSSQVAGLFDDERIRIIRQPNQGLANSLNCGIREARAPYVARSDQDDVSRPTRIERQVAVLDTCPDAVAVFSHWSKFGLKRSWANADKQRTGGPIRAFDPSADGCLLASTMLARTAALRSVGGYRQAYYPADDWDLELRLSDAGPILIVPEPLVAYRFHTAANTYRLFVLDQDKGRWAEDSHRRRHQGEAELPFARFLEVQEAGRSRRTARDASKLHMRTAGQRYLDGHDAAAAFHLVTSAVLDPSGLVGRAARLAGRVADVSRAFRWSR